MQVRVAIVGAGVAGLTAAGVLQQAGVEHISIFEARDRVGGRMFTVRNEFSVDVELGAGWIQGSSPLCEFR